MDGNLSDISEDCPTIVDTIFDHIEYSVDKKLGCIRTDGKSCCMALCSNNYRCQREASVRIPLESIVHEELECVKYTTLSNASDAPKPESLHLCSHHAKVFQTLTPAAKPFNYLTWAVKESLLIICKSAATIVISEGIKMATGLPMSTSLTSVAVGAASSNIIGAVNSRLVDAKIKKRLSYHSTKSNSLLGKVS